MTPETSASPQKQKKKDTPRRVALLVTLLGMIVLLYFELGKPTLSENEVLQRLMTMTITRMTGAAVFFAILVSLGYRVLNPIRKPFLKSLLFCIPAFLVVINNMPILALVWGNATLVHTEWYFFLWFGLECLAIGLFEEAAFRGVALLMLAEKRRSTTKGLFISILLSSAVFGVIHLANLLTGADPGAVILQIGYSFLIGAMCSVVLFKTANLWLCVLLHAVYDFGGHLVSTLGEGKLWDTPTVVLTAVLAVLTTVYMVVAFVRMKPSEVERLYVKGEKESPETA